MNLNNIMKKTVLLFMMMFVFVMLGACAGDDERTVLAEIEDTEITDEKADFQQLLGLMHIELLREEGATSMDEETFEYMSEMWNDQEAQVKNMNHTLTSVIRTVAMAKLAEEKGYQLTEEVVSNQYNEFLEQYQQGTMTTTLIEEFGTDKFEAQLEEYTEEWLLARIVYNDVVEEVQSANPEMEIEEVQHIADQNYEDLLVSQMETLEVTIHPYN